MEPPNLNDELETLVTWLCICSGILLIVLMSRGCP